MASGATCVQRLDDSRDSAIHTKYRISLRSSSMREPRYPLPRVVLNKWKTSTPQAHAHRVRGGKAHALWFQIPWHIPRRGSVVRDEVATVASPWFVARRAARRFHDRFDERPRSSLAPCGYHGFSGRSAGAGFDNDPSAGSPTETLLRLLLPLNDKVQWTSRDVAGSEPPTSPRSEHFTGPFNR
jgi:hypothetical protein